MVRNTFAETGAPVNPGAASEVITALNSIAHIFYAHFYAFYLLAISWLSYVTLQAFCKHAVPYTLDTETENPYYSARVLVGSCVLGVGCRVGTEVEGG